IPNASWIDGSAVASRVSLVIPMKAPVSRAAIIRIFCRCGRPQEFSVSVTVCFPSSGSAMVESAWGPSLRQGQGHRLSARGRPGMIARSDGDADSLGGTGPKGDNDVGFLSIPRRGAEVGTGAQAAIGPAASPPPG